MHLAGAQISHEPTMQTWPSLVLSLFNAYEVPELELYAYISHILPSRQMFSALAGSGSGSCALLINNQGRTALSEVAITSCCHIPRPGAQ